MSQVHGRFRRLRLRSVRKQQVDRWAAVLLCLCFWPSRRCFRLDLNWICLSVVALASLACRPRLPVAASWPPVGRKMAMLPHLLPRFRYPHFRPLRRVAEDQAEFEIGETAGTLIGFWSPRFVGFSLTLPGFHFHFLAGEALGACAGLLLCCVSLLIWLPAPPLCGPLPHPAQLPLPGSGCAPSECRLVVLLPLLPLLDTHHLPMACSSSCVRQLVQPLQPCTRGSFPLCSLPLQMTSSGEGTCWNRSCWRARRGCR